MKTPTWATAIGIIMIIFGGCGAFSDIRSTVMPEKLGEERQRMKIRIAEKNASKSDSTTAEAIAENDSTTIASDSTDEYTEKKEVPFFGKKSPEEMLNLSEFSATWIVRFGYIGAAVSLIYLLGGVFLLKRKVFSIKLAYGALVLSILVAGAQTAVLTSSATGDFMSKMIGLGQLPGLLIDIILLAVVFASDKEAYKEENLTR